MIRKRQSVSGKFYRTAFAGSVILAAVLIFSGCGADLKTESDGNRGTSEPSAEESSEAFAGLKKDPVPGGTSPGADKEGTGSKEPDMEGDGIPDLPRAELTGISGTDNLGEDKEGKEGTDQISEGVEDGDAAAEYSSIIMKCGTLSGADEAGSSITVTVSGSYTNDMGESTEYKEDIIFHAPDGMPVLDAASGLPLSLTELNENDYVYIWAEDMMTLSLPAQMYMRALVTGVAEDSAAPLYIEVRDVSLDTASGVINITDHDGITWKAQQGITDITAFRTRQIVSLEDIKEGSALFIYSGESNFSGDCGDSPDASGSTGQPDENAAGTEEISSYGYLNKIIFIR